MVTDRDIVCKGLTQNFDAVRPTARAAKAVRHMEALQVRRLPVINKCKRMIGILSLGDISHWATGDMLSECVKSVAAHH